jgi:hypothetical protein
VWELSAYQFPARDAVETLNSLLKLPASGMEQDWEIEMADGNRLAEFLAVFGSANLDLECRSALGLLMLFSITYADDAPVSADLLASVRWAIRKDREVYERMLSYWSDGFLEHEIQIQQVLA